VPGGAPKGTAGLSSRTDPEKERQRVAALEAKREAAKREREEAHRSAVRDA
jgi:hypothetical protein